MTLREWDVTSVALRLARRHGEGAALDIAERLIRKWAESEAPVAAQAAIRWVRIKAILFALTCQTSSIH